MNRTLDSLARGPLAIVGALLAALALLWALVVQGQTTFIVPAPETVAEQFFAALQAHNYGAARDQLSDELRQAVSADDLRQMTERLSQTTSPIEAATGQSAQIQGQSATAAVQLKLKNGDEPTLAVPLSQAQGLWHITSLAPLEALIGP